MKYGRALLGLGTDVARVLGHAMTNEEEATVEAILADASSLRRLMRGPWTRDAAERNAKRDRLMLQITLNVKFLLPTADVAFHVEDPFRIGVKDRRNPVGSPFVLVVTDDHLPPLVSRRKRGKKGTRR